jgi:hypothetical protein
MAAIECFYHLHAGPLEHLNGAYIALIPKSDVAEHAADFRPISLINSFAKLTTKARHCPYGYQGTLISLFPNSQSAFIKGRCIQDNFMYVRNLAGAYNRTKTHALLFKLDIFLKGVLPQLLRKQRNSNRIQDWGNQFNIQQKPKPNT